MSTTRFGSARGDGGRGYRPVRPVVAPAVQVWAVLALCVFLLLCVVVGLWATGDTEPRRTRPLRSRPATPPLRTPVVVFRGSLSLREQVVLPVPAHDLP